MYEHGGGIDAPLGVVRMEYSSELRDPQVIVPHSNWRGSYDRGTPIVGSCLVYSSNGKMLAPPPDSTPSSGDQYGGVVGGGTYGGTKEHCVEVDWPASYTWSALQYRRGYAGPSAWMGSLIFESRDASGLYYRRNRYYDSEKGRFTQEDPIGLAGGVNVYGFANGDPVSYSDPYGLCPTPPWDCPAAAAALKAKLFDAALGALAAVGELTGVSGAMRFFSGRNPDRSRLSTGERAFEGVMMVGTVVVEEGKIGYLFGRASGRAHNIARAAQNQAQMRRVGATTEEIAEHMIGVAKNPTNVSGTFTTQWGSYEIRESLYAGRTGQFVKFESTWEILSDGTRRFVTAIPYGGR
jgi:RHS repeat-associated protein